jgi:hypothetical protein
MTIRKEPIYMLNDPQLGAKTSIKPADAGREVTRGQHYLLGELTYDLTPSFEIPAFNVPQAEDRVPRPQPRQLTLF